MDSKYTGPGHYYITLDDLSFSYPKVVIQIFYTEEERLVYILKTPGIKHMIKAM